ncbi:MAG: glycosyltransferase family 2 protein [Caldimonas sp.]
MTRDPVPSSPLEWPRRALAAAFLLASAWYLGWRCGTLNPAAPGFSALLYGAELFGFATALLHVFMGWRLTLRHAAVPRAGIGVDVFVTTQHEPVELVRKTLLAVRAMDYPHRTWLLDDGARPEMRALARQLGGDDLARAGDDGARAGALNHALAQSNGALVVVFDADHAPRRDFLTKTLGYFDDERVAFVQTPQDFYNLDSYEHRWHGIGPTVWTERTLFFRVIQRGKDYWNSAFFCGSCAVLRRSALDGIGGFATGTQTEGLHTSLRLHARGHRSVYHAEPLAFGLAPDSIEPFIGQRVRWGQGTMQVWRREGILLRRGLTLAQRLSYLASALTYFRGWQKAIFYFTPAVVLATGLLPLTATTPDFLLHFVPYWLLSLWIFEEVGRGYGRSLFVEQYHMARFAAFAWATLALIFPRMKFAAAAEVAPDGRSAVRFTAPQWAVLALNLAALPVGTALCLRAGTLPLQGLLAAGAWALVNVALACAVLAFTAISRRNTRDRYRFPITLPAEIVVAGGTRLRGTVDDLSENGLRFYGKLPPGLAPGDKITGQLLLPEGPVAFWGEVRGQIAMPGRPDVVKALGCQFSTSDEGRNRLEEFLFGSDLQWILNGYTDRAQTPMSRWLPELVDGPRHNPFADVRWNAAEVRVDADGEAEPVLLSATAIKSGDVYIVSHHVLPEKRALILDVHLRTDTAARDVWLQRLALPGIDNPDARLSVYRVIAQGLRPAPAPADAPAPAIRPARRAEPQRSFDALPSTH